MRRTDLDNSDDRQEDILISLARYKFVSRLIRPTDRLVEIGCGSGHGARFLAEKAAWVTASDPEPEVLASAKARFTRENLEYVEVPTCALGPYDVAVCLEVIQNLSKPDGEKLLGEMKQLIKPDGALFISTPRKILNPSENRKKYHLHEYEYEEFRALLEKVYRRAFVLTQVDEIISTHIPSNAWYFIACCCP